MQKVETTETENHRQSKCSVVEPRPSGYIYNTLLSLRLRLRSVIKAVGKVLRVRG